MRVPETTECTAAESYPGRVEVRIASRDAVDIVNPTCATLATRAYADCWDYLTNIRVDDGGGDPDNAPVVREVNLGGAGGPTGCAPDAYFARIPGGVGSCSYNAFVKVDWGERRSARIPAKFTVQVEGSGPVQGAAAGGTATTHDVFGINTDTAPPGGGDQVSVTLSWLDLDTTHTAPGEARAARTMRRQRRASTDR